MVLNGDMTAAGFSLRRAEREDYSLFFDIQRECYKSYVEEYFGGWNEEDQHRRCDASFEEMSAGDFFAAVTLGGEVAGFIGYDVKADRIDGVSIQLRAGARNRGLGSYFLEYLTGLADDLGLPVYLKVFKSNPARHLYRQFGFSVFDEDDSHYKMRYSPSVK